VKREKPVSKAAKLRGKAAKIKRYVDVKRLGRLVCYEKLAPSL